MRTISLRTFYLLLFGVGVRSEGSFNLTDEERVRNPALGKITQAQTIIDTEFAKLSNDQQTSGSVEMHQKAMDSKLDAMKKTIAENGELTNGGNSGKIKSVGEAATATAALIQNAVNGDFRGPQGGKKMAAAIISITKTFLDIGGAFAPPPIGQAISTGFGILNTIMSLAGLTPKVPSQMDIMKELLDEQTKEIKNMIGDVLDQFWTIILDDSKAMIAELESPMRDLNDYINIPTENLQCAVLEKISDLMTDADGNLASHLSKLRSKFEKHCPKMKDATDENKCLILLEIYSEIFKTYTDLNELAIGVFNKHENITRSSCDRKLGLESTDTNRNACPGLAGLVCFFHRQIRQETDHIRQYVLNPILKNIDKFGSEQPSKTSTLCLKTNILTPGKFNFTKHALTAAEVELKITASEESSKDIVCPSSKTKLMLVGGWNEKIQILSPDKECKEEIPYLPCDGMGMGIAEFCNKNFHNRRGTAFYKTRDGDERVMVCGGQTWAVYHPMVTNWCYSINSKTGSNWKREAFMPKAVMKPSMVFDSYNIHSFGGYTLEELEKYHLYINYAADREAPWIHGPWWGGFKGAMELDNTKTKAVEQIWQMDVTKGNYAWKANAPQIMEGPISYNERYRSFIGARCTVFHDGQFYSQGIEWIKSETPGPAQYTKKKSKSSESLQETLDHYCRTTLPKELPACSNMNFARKDAEGLFYGESWRCFKSVDTDKTALACVGNDGKMVECSAPVTVGGQYCTRTELNMLVLRHSVESESLQENLDDYCRTTLPKELPACSNMNFARMDGESWRCFKSVDTDKTALACVGNDGKLVKCSAPVTVGGQYCTRQQLNDILIKKEAGKPKIDYTHPIPGCLWGLEEGDPYTTSLRDCQNRCNEKSWCRSLYYVEDHNLCYLSKHTKLSDPDYWKGECSDFVNPNYYTSAKYYAKIIHDTASTIGLWNDLPTYPNSLIYTCTVGVIYGQTSFVTSGPKGVYYLPIPYNPETNPKPKWKRLGNPPKECGAALGWADGKLLCVPASKPRPHFYYEKDFYYFQENDGCWVTKTLKGHTFGMESYVTVSGAFDNKCEK